MEILGVKWSLGTMEEFRTLFVTTLVVMAITFGGNQLLGILRGKNWKHRPNGLVFTLLLAVSILLGGWMHKWLFN